MFVINALACKIFVFTRKVASAMVASANRFAVFAAKTIGKIGYSIPRSSAAGTYFFAISK